MVGNTPPIDRAAEAAVVFLINDLLDVGIIL
jgi:hypothetical protein